MDVGTMILQGTIIEATRRTLSRSGNPRFKVEFKDSDGVMHTLPTKTDSDVNYDIENNIGKEVTLTIDAIGRITYLQKA